MRYEDLEDALDIFIENDNGIKYPNGFNKTDANNSEIRLKIIGNNYTDIKDIFIN